MRLGVNGLSELLFIYPDMFSKAITFLWDGLPVGSCAKDLSNYLNILF